MISSLLKPPLFHNSPFFKDFYFCKQLRLVLVLYYNKFMKKTEKEIYNEYLKYNHRRPFLFGKESHWRTHYEGYEVGYEDGVEETQESWYKELGMDLEKFPVNVEEQFNVMKKALQEYYESKK